MSVFTAEDCELVTLDEAAEIACVARETVRKWIRRYDLRAQVIDGRTYVSVVSLERTEIATRRTGRGRPRLVLTSMGICPTLLPADDLCPQPGQRAGLRHVRGCL